ncbi:MULTISPECIES: myo-inosose-2 dehydratase [unclassified Paenibacillus]|uniref:myo-inosose-2 dehydratase n=1 Tax=unclassified Paenibacillus TaxID=185978 RepID=UPI0024060A72|nr:MULTISPECIES: myo-inosose-2 dehydratase [unclassified Paenibacillus]MDF9840803.1 inosose dehydratase [Paenibacillus sp. PastF-2]MDF9847386.1 inosose dehydratase [Paenibacillus sp. PastM-2]MDF9854036.1 inosose dehydratase [Paenibacillus sp. PastF-1]MDH6479309.1 inosose dehydratase [Paenibacillus sp. PastH-2]MDH6506956.1 inosose dehydratase [Paenibacillus sp. PastM-3]
MFKEEAVRLAIAPIAWTNDDMPELGRGNTFEQCISEMALAGFQGSEVGNKYPRSPEVLHRALGLRGLQIASAWFSAHLTVRPYEETAEAFVAHRDFLHAMGAKVIVVSEQGRSIQGQMDTPLFDAKPVFTEDEWALLAEGLGKLGRRAAEKGMAIVYHHHMGTGVQTAAEIARLMELTDPAEISLLFDTGHLAFSGENPLEVLRAHLPRIRHVHLKDIRPEVVRRVIAEKLSFLQAVKAGAFTVPGDGCIEFADIFAELAGSSYTGWFVVEAEQDPALADPLEYAIKARKYIRETSGL